MGPNRYSLSYLHGQLGAGLEVVSLFLHPKSVIFSLYQTYLVQGRISLEQRTSSQNTVAGRIFAWNKATILEFKVG